MENELAKKYEGEGIIVKYDAKGRAFVSFPVSGVPIKQWEEWNRDCEQRFNSARWQKIYLDHRLMQTYETLDNDVQQVIPQEVSTEKKGTVLIGGEVLEE